MSTPGTLDGLTVFRFAHMWRDPGSGGVEGYLHNVNRALLERNHVRILQMYLVRPGEPLAVERERVAQGEIVWIPSPYKAPESPTRSFPARLLSTLRHRGKPQCEVDHSLLQATLAEHPLDVALFHWLSDDSEGVMNYLEGRGVPCAIVHHFRNRRLLARRALSQVDRAVAIGGVTGVDVPDSLASRFTNLSDAVDIGFFSPGFAPARPDTAEPVILLPSRVYREKGHLDAVRALISLKKSGVAARLVFAGRVESEAYLDRVMRLAARDGLQDRVVVLRQVSPSQLLEWYAAAAVVILPSYDEGLPRVLLEAQSMGKPVVAYNVGGVPEALVEGQTGWMVKVGNTKELGRRILEVLRSPAWRDEAAHRGRDFVVSQFSGVALARRHEEFCQRVRNTRP